MLEIGSVVRVTNKAYYHYGKFGTVVSICKATGVVIVRIAGVLYERTFLPTDLKKVNSKVCALVAFCRWCMEDWQIDYYHKMIEKKFPTLYYPDLDEVGKDYYKDQLCTRFF